MSDGIYNLTFRYNNESNRSESGNVHWSRAVLKILVKDEAHKRTQSCTKNIGMLSSPIEFEALICLTASITSPSDIIMKATGQNQEMYIGQEQC
jgi:hypothetical protein